MEIDRFALRMCNYCLPIRSSPAAAMLLLLRVFSPTFGAHLFVLAISLLFILLPTVCPNDENDENAKTMDENRTEQAIPLSTADTEPLSAESLDALFSIGAGLFFKNFTENRRPKKPTSPELSCNAQEKSLCQDAQMCVRKSNASDFECICRKGQAGRFCQFSLFPRTCADAFAFHFDESEFEHEEVGVWQLDLDGSAPLQPTYAECRSNGAKTVVSHNVPSDGVVARGNGMPNNKSSVFFPISYRLFSANQFRALIARSESCRQNIRFDCEQSPLDFKGNSTWLEVVSREGQQHRQIGTKEFSCACRNKELYGCGRDDPALNCYCDDLTQSKAFDQATLTNADSGVSAIYFRQTKDAKAGKQSFTLGPVECEGEAGTTSNALVILRSPTGGLESDTFHGWRQLEFDFRTGQPSIEQMVVGKDEQGEVQLRISLRSNYRIELQLAHHHDEQHTIQHRQQQNGQANVKKERGIRREMSISIASKKALNDLDWHRVIVEMFRGEIRFSIDRLNAFQPVTFPFPEATRFSIGGDEQGNGFVGCMGNFQVDRVLVDWRQQLRQRDEDARVMAGCPDLCADHQCAQESRCIEHFDTESTSCECKQSRIHYGEHCEKNFNDNSSITFHAQNAFLRFASQPASALHSDVVFSIRTDQKRALLLYEHDQADNFVQIHLANERSIVLTLNNLSHVLSCAVHAKNNKVFNHMRWLQIVLERNADGIGSAALLVDDQRCETAPGGGILLNPPNGLNEESENDEEDIGGSDTILPPARFDPSLSPHQPFHVLFIGGLPRGGRLRNGRAKKDKRNTGRERLPIYASGLPSLRGCVRGLLVDGEKVDLRDAVFKRQGRLKRGKDAIQIGCEHISCDQLHCQNGGHCAVDWTQRTNPAAVHCDCATTTYTGQNCTNDLGLSFDGRSFIEFDLTEPKRFGLLHESERQTFRLAWTNAATSKQRHAQLLWSVLFGDGRLLSAVLDTNGTLIVAVLAQNGTVENVEMVAGEFSDGYRHQLIVHFASNHVHFELPQLDRNDAEWTFKQTISLAEAKQIYFGGSEGVSEVELETKSEESTSSSASAEPNDAQGAPENLLILADAMREILARSAPEEGTENGTQVEKTETGIGQKPNGEDEWPARIERFQGCISGVLVEFWRDSSQLVFDPFHYYLREDELWHRTVRHFPPTAERLSLANCGTFKLPQVLKKPNRNVQFPLWEAPFHPVPFINWDPAASSQSPQMHTITVSLARPIHRSLWPVWVIPLVLIVLLLLAILVWCCCCRKKQSGEMEVVEPEQKPMLDRGKNGKTEMEPVLIRQKTLSSSSPPPPPPPPKPPKKSILKNVQMPGEDQISFPFASTALYAEQPSTPPEEQIPSEGPSARSSDASAYFTAQEQFPDGESSTAESGASSFVSLPEQRMQEEDEEGTESGGESTVIGRAFGEQAPELMDESTLQLSNGVGSSFASSSVNSLAGDIEAQKEGEQEGQPVQVER